MILRELTFKEFEDFTFSHELGNHYQTNAYAMLMVEIDYEYDFIGLVDDNNNVYAASLILFKKIKRHQKYGYAPKGFILDYFNKDLFREFTKKLQEYYAKKNVVFIKINPEIAIAQINPKTGEKSFTTNLELKELFSELGYYKLKDNLYFESQLPHYNAIINLKSYNISNVSKNTRNKIRRAEQKGLKIELAERSGIDIFYEFIKKMRRNDKFYYLNYYNVFKKNNMIDLFLVRIDTKDFLYKSNALYEKELESNQEINQLLIEDNNQKNINKKMNSDRALLNYKNDVLEATDKNAKQETYYIAGALVIKYENRIQIVISGYDQNFKHFNPNYFLHNEILNYYKKDYDFADLNGFTGDLSPSNPYYGLNEFKAGFNPNIYEFIGEYDLVVNPMKYQKFLNNGVLQKIFEKTKLKKGKENNLKQKPLSRTK